MQSSMIYKYFIFKQFEISLASIKFLKKGKSKEQMVDTCIKEADTCISSLYLSNSVQVMIEKCWIFFLIFQLKKGHYFVINESRIMSNVLQLAD